MKLLDILENMTIYHGNDGCNWHFIQDGNKRIYMSNHAHFAFDSITKRWEALRGSTHQETIFCFTADVLAEDYDTKILSYNELWHHQTLKRAKQEPAEKLKSKAVVKIKINDTKATEEVTPVMGEMKFSGVLSANTLEEELNNAGLAVKKIKAGEPIGFASGTYDTNTVKANNNGELSVGAIVDVYDLSGEELRAGAKIIAKGEMIWVLSHNGIEFPIQWKDYIVKVSNPEGRAIMALREYTDKPNELLHAIVNGNIPNVEFKA